MVISPFAKQNYVDHNLSDQSSIIKLIEYNWTLPPLPGIPGSADQALAASDLSEGVPFDMAGLFKFGGRRAQRLLLDPSTGQPVR